MTNPQTILAAAENRAQSSLLDLECETLRASIERIDAMIERASQLRKEIESREVTA